MSSTGLTGRVTLFGLALILAGCGFGHVPASPTYLDLGAPPVASAQRSPSLPMQPTQATLPALALSTVVTSGTLSDTGVIWRLGPDGHPNTYATVRWTATPAALVRERLYSKLSQQGPVVSEPLSANMPQLKVALLQFEQIYAPDGSGSDAVITLQALLVTGTRVQGPYGVTERVPATQNNAVAGAQALRIATDRAVQSVAQWLAQTISP